MDLELGLLSLTDIHTHTHTHTERAMERVE